MPAFLEDITPFIGNGSRNEKGQTLEEFLEAYDPSKYESPSVTADVMVFKYAGDLTSVYDKLSILMVKRRNHPSIGLWALPGGFCEMREDICESARRELEEETGLKNIPIEQVYTWGEAWRDPRDRIITTAFIALVDETVHEPVAGDDAAEAEWFDISFSKVKEEIVNECGRERVKSTYSIVLSCELVQEKCAATVVVTENASGLLKETRYEVTESINIAFDHARFIVNGLLYIDNM